MADGSIPRRRPRVIGLVGLPGSGKSTLGSALAGQLGWEVVAIGAALRARAKFDAGLARSLSQGELASESEVESLVRSAAALAGAPGVVLDGFPRHAAQLELFFELFDRPLIVYLELPAAVAIARASDRGNNDELSRPEDSPSIVERRVQSSLGFIAGLLRAIPPDSLIKLDGSIPPAILAATVRNELSFE